MFKRWMFRLFLLLLALINIGAAIQAFQYVSVLAYPEGYRPALTIPLPVLGGVHVLLALSCIGILVTQWHIKCKTLVYIWAGAYQVVNWLMHLLGDISTYARILWVRKVLFTILFVLMILWLTHTRNPEKKQT